MDILFTVSPGYLGPIYEISKDFSFEIQGYPNFKQACDGILKVNYADLIGVLIVLEDFPEKLGTIVRFLEKINLMDTDLPVIISHNDSEGLLDLLHYTNLKNVNLHIVDMSCIVTDNFIRNKLFKPFLLSTYPAYKGLLNTNDLPYKTLYETYSGKYRLKERKYSEERIKPNYFEFKPIIDRISSITLSNFDGRKTFEATLRFDKNLKLLSEFPIYKNIRLYMMAVAVGDKEKEILLEKEFNRNLRTVDELKQKIKYKTIFKAAKKQGDKKYARRIAI